MSESLHLSLIEAKQQGRVVLSKLDNTTSINPKSDRPVFAQIILNG